MGKDDFQAFPVDHNANIFSPKVPTFTIDSSNSDEVKVAQQLFRFTRPVAVHLGLMCGTCSAPEPAPLRDELHLFGKPNLKPWNTLKVDKANIIYQRAIELLYTCFELDCMFP